MDPTARRTLPISPARRLLLSLALALAWSLAFGLVASLGATALALASPDPSALLAPLALAVTALCALLCGFLTSHRAHLSPLLCGALAGGAHIALLWLMSTPFPSDHAWAPSLAWGLRGGMLVFALLGASLGSSLPKRRRRPRRQRSTAQKKRP